MQGAPPHCIINVGRQGTPHLFSVCADNPPTCKDFGAITFRQADPAGSELFFCSPASDSPIFCCNEEAIALACFADQSTGQKLATLRVMQYRPIAFDVGLSLEAPIATN